MKGWVVVDRRKKKPVIWHWSYSDSKYETIAHMDTIVFGELKMAWETAHRLKNSDTTAPLLRYARKHGFTIERAEVRLVKKVKK